MRCLELFAGCGGAARGLEAAGFSHAALCEWDRDACVSLRAAGLGPVVEGDVRDLDAIGRVAGPSVDVLWSSFPCQAWSSAGKRKGAMDDRNGWPWTLAAIDRFRPTWFIGENVRGLLQHAAECQHKGGQRGLFRDDARDTCPGCYFENVIIPELRLRFGSVVWWVLDAADFGIPQHRRRVFIVAGPHRPDPPTPTHGPGRLPYVSIGEALGIEGEVQAGVGDTDSGMRGSPRKTSQPAPTVSSASRLYFRDGQAVRRLTVEECATLQGMPAPTCGGVESRYRQVGNAVPPLLAEVVARQVQIAEPARDTIPF